MFKVISKWGDKVNEIWVPLIYRCVKPDLYEISNLGNVRNIKTGKILKPVPSEKDYMMVCLRCNDENCNSRREIWKRKVDARTQTITYVKCKFYKENPANECRIYEDENIEDED